MASAACSASSAPTSRILRSAAAAAGSKKMTCLCSPTNHPGSFRCSRHRNGPAAGGGGGGEAGHGHGGGGSSRAAKGRSVRALLLQRIGGGELGRQRQHRRRGAGDFQPRPSRLRLMNL